MADFSTKIICKSALKNFSPNRKKNARVNKLQMGLCIFHTRKVGKKWFITKSHKNEINHTKVWKQIHVFHI